MIRAENNKKSNPTKFGWLKYIAPPLKFSKQHFYILSYPQYLSISTLARLSKSNPHFILDKFELLLPSVSLKLSNQRRETLFTKLVNF